MARMQLKKASKKYTVGYNGAHMDGNDFTSKINMLIFKAFIYLTKLGKNFVPKV